MPRSALAERLGVEMPIAREVQRALFEGKSVQRCLVDLLARESKDELADFGRWLERGGARRGAGEAGPGCVSAAGDARLPPRRGVAQPGSAPEWGSGGRAFESLRPDQRSEHERGPEGDPPDLMIPGHTASILDSTTTRQELGDEDDDSQNEQQVDERPTDGTD